MSGFFGVLNLDGPAASPDLCIWADARLDSRDLLERALGVPRKNDLDDAGLILAAWRKWGEECVDHLFGDFAFAIFDPSEMSVFCARDRLGTRPYYYHYAQGQRYVFASDARFVFSVDDVPYRINEGRIADFIVPALEWIDLTSTFYEGVFRLPPGYKAMVTPSAMHLTEYWAPEHRDILDLANDAEYCEAFLDVFSPAVEERLCPPCDMTGATLSGGMDSGSIVAMGAERIHPYSLARGRDIDCQESKRIFSTLDYLGLSGTQIIAGDVASLADDLGREIAEPFDGEFLFLEAIYKRARKDGIDVVLDGAAGDVVFNESGYVARMLRRGNIAQAWREVSGQQAFGTCSSRTAAVLRYLVSAFAPGVVKDLLRPPRQRRIERQFVRGSLIDPTFARRIDIKARFERMRETFSAAHSEDVALDRLLKIRPNLTAGRERYARIAASAGIETRDPFTDHRVVDFCSRLPDNQLARNGWPKFLLRNAMEGRLPDMVRWGHGKPHIGYIYNQTFLGREKTEGRLNLDSVARATEGYIDSVALQRAWTEYEAGGDFEPVHSAYILSLWLSKSVTRPVVKYQGFGYSSGVSD